MRSNLMQKKQLDFAWWIRTHSFTDPKSHCTSGRVKDLPATCCILRPDEIWRAEQGGAFMHSAARACVPEPSSTAPDMERLLKSRQVPVGFHLIAADRLERSGSAGHPTRASEVTRRWSVALRWTPACCCQTVGDMTRPNGRRIRCSKRS